MFLVNLVGFQLGWWSLVLSASKGKPEWGLGIAAILLFGHFLFYSKKKLRDLLILVPCLLIGILGDTLLIKNGVFINPEGSMIPLWLVGLWILFPLTLPYSFKAVMINRKLLLFVGIMAGFSYYAGQAFEILLTPDPMMLNLGINAFVWMFYLSVFRLILKLNKAI